MFATRLLFRSTTRSFSASQLPALRNVSRFQARSFKTTPSHFQRFGRSQYQRFDTGPPFLNLVRRWAARPTFYYELGGLGGVCGLFYISNLEQVPTTGRRRFNVVGAATEKQLGTQMYQQTLQEYRGRILPPHDRRSQMVTRVLERLIPCSGLDDLGEWEVHVIDDDSQKNAFVIPGGKVFVFTGILPICRDDDGLATVLGHEIGHNVAHHVAEKMSANFILMAAAMLLAWTLDVSGQSTGMLLDLGFMKPASRKQESEADYIGLMMMAKACYNPEAAPELWTRMQKSEEVSIPQFISTHPSNFNRKGKLEEWLPQALDAFNSSECSSTGEYVNQFRQAFKDRA